MPLTKTEKQKIAYSKPVLLPNGMITLGLFDKDHKLIEYRACKLNTKTKHFNCPSNKTNPKAKKELQKKLGINKLNKKLK